ncbi:MAG TPA: hypothetical protein VJ998_00040 [Pseudomonadales bacterium]|nr:hypothetical protein [Pseudomonadales bacterium]
MSMTLSTLKHAMKQINEDSALRKLGSCDAIMGIKVASKCYAVTFTAFEVGDVSEIEQDDLREVDFYIDMKKKDWDTFLASLASDAPQSLNVLDLEQGIVKGADTRRKLAFTQYHLSFQRFFEVAAAA